MTVTICRAAVLVEYNAPLEIRELPVPVPEAGALVVKITAATMCGSEVHLWRGDYARAFPMTLPVTPGQGAGNSGEAEGCCVFSHRPRFGLLPCRRADCWRQYGSAAEGESAGESMR